MSERAIILFAGGGTGGHIFPNVAIAQRLIEADTRLGAKFIVSTRELDRQILEKSSLEHIELEALPFSARPWRLPSFVRAWRRSMARMGEVLRGGRVVALIATGGFVSAPAIAAAGRVGVPVGMVNLDAEPGKANRLMARRAGKLFSVYPVARWPKAGVIGMPLRREATTCLSQGQAREALGLASDRPVLLVTGGSQGARSINEMMVLLARRHELPRGWQVFHLAGSGDLRAISDAYREAGVAARVQAFEDEMGLAWRAAGLAIARCGASTCAEAWAGGCPCVFLPYPYHRDDHQRRNAQPLVDAGGAVIVRDRVDPGLNAEAVMGQLRSLFKDDSRRRAMAAALRSTAPADGAETVARWLRELVAMPR